MSMQRLITENSAARATKRRGLTINCGKQPEGHGRHYCAVSFRLEGNHRACRLRLRLRFRPPPRRFALSELRLALSVRLRLGLLSTFFSAPGGSPGSRQETRTFHVPSSRSQVWKPRVFKRSTNFAIMLWSSSAKSTGPGVYAVVVPRVA